MFPRQDTGNGRSIDTWTQKREKSNSGPIPEIVLIRRDTSLQPPLDRAEGWPSEFSEAVSAGGKRPRREVFNQLFREISGAVVSWRERGIAPWSAEEDYPVNGFTASGPKLYRATVATGPVTGNATDPATLGQTVWEGVSGSLIEPGQVVNIVATVSNGAVSLRWPCPLDGGSVISRFEVRQRVQGASWGSVQQLMTEPIHSVSGLVIGNTYEFQIRAVNATGNGEWSDTVTAIPIPGVPAQVTGLNLVASPGQIEASWDAPDLAGNALSGYVVQWRNLTGGGGAESFGNANQVTVTELTATITGLVNDRRYEIRVRANNGPWSAEAQAVAGNGYIRFPHSGTALDTAITFSWPWNRDARVLLCGGAGGGGGGGGGGGDFTTQIAYNLPEAYEGSRRSRWSWWYRNA